MATSADASTPKTGDLPAGQRLQCDQCGSEVEIIQPCTCNPSTLELVCCRQPMRPIVGQDVHLSVE